MENNSLKGEVSFIEYTDNGFNRSSKYLEVEYRPKCASFEASHILNNFFMLDIKQSVENNNNLLYNFFEILKKCKSDADFDDVRKFFLEVSKVGTVGRNFFETRSDLIGEKGLVMLNKLEQSSGWQAFKQKKMKEMERINQQLELKEKNSKEESQVEVENSISTENFLRQYKIINLQFDNFNSMSLKDEKKLTELIEKYSYLQTVLNILQKNNKITDEEFKNCSDEMVTKIDYLSSLSNGIDDIKRTWRH